MFRHFTKIIKHTIPFSTFNKECHQRPSNDTIKSAMNLCFKLELKQSRIYFGIKIHHHSIVGMSYFIRPKKLLVTNYHLIEGLNDQKYLSELIIGDNPNDFKHKIVHTDPTKDLAFIEFDNSDVVTPNHIVQLYRQITGLPSFLMKNLMHYIKSRIKFLSHRLLCSLYTKLFNEEIEFNEKNNFNKCVFAFKFMFGNTNIRFGDKIRYISGSITEKNCYPGRFKFIENGGNDDMKIIVVKMFTYPGFSGGPLFDCNGDLLGIIFAACFYYGETLVISNEEMLKTLQKYKSLNN